MQAVSLNHLGVLPEGIHELSLKDVERIFGRFTTTDRRQRLCTNLMEYCSEIRKVDFVDHLILNGSFVTNKDVPGDIDFILVLRPGHTPSETWSQRDLNLVSRRWVRRKYEMEVVTVRKESEEHVQYLEFFSQVKECPGIRKGLVRLVL